MKLTETLGDYLRRKKISVGEFSKLTGVSPFHLYKIKEDRESNVCRSTMEKIYRGTATRYDKGLLPQDYLNIIN